MASYESGYDPKYGYNRNAFAHKTIVTSILGRTVKLIAAPIGLVSEAVHHHKEKRRTDSQSEDQLGKKPAAEHTPKDSGESTSPVLVHVPAEQAEELIAKHEAVLADGESSTHDLMPVESTEDDGIDKDEADWALDDAAHEIEGDEQEEHLLQKAIVPKTSSIITSKKHNSRSLPFPVIIPQRRPGTKTRGFVRAYAPILEDAGIDQHMFLTFLKDFHKAAQASPVFDVIIVTTAIAGFYPDPIAGIAIQAVQIAAAIGQEVQERWRLNKFLDQANRDIFIPRGVYALIVTYVPGGSGDGEIGTQTIDIGASAYVKYGGAVTPAEDASGAEIEENRVHKIDEIKEKMKRLRVASGQTHGEAELPATCAPLIFPTLDTAARKDTRESVGDEIKAKSKSTSKFVQAYFDRRAQASYVSVPYLECKLPFQCTTSSIQIDAEQKFRHMQIQTQP